MSPWSTLVNTVWLLLWPASRHTMQRRRRNFASPRNCFCQCNAGEQGHLPQLTNRSYQSRRGRVVLLITLDHMKSSPKCEEDFLRIAPRPLLIGTESWCALRYLRLFLLLRIERSFGNSGPSSSIGEKGYKKPETDLFGPLCHYKPLSLLSPSDLLNRLSIFGKLTR